MESSKPPKKAVFFVEKWYNKNGKMNKYKIIILTALLVLFSTFLVFLLQGGNIPVLNPKGITAIAQRRVIVESILIMLLAIIPALLMIFLFAYRFRADNAREKYDPNFSLNPRLQILWWGLPIVVILVLAVLTFKSVHRLDPFKPLDSPNKPLTIQVVALNWKWLFIYPQQNIATVNFIQIPQKTPIHFQLTADAPMNLFWIPQLGGQMSAMPGMSTQLNLMADETGEYNGLASEINGKGLSGMRFVVKTTSQADFDEWVQLTKNSAQPLSMDVYNQLSKPSENNPKAFYSSVENDLYRSVMMKYAVPMIEKIIDN